MALVVKIWDGSTETTVANPFGLNYREQLNDVPTGQVSLPYDDTAVAKAVAGNDVRLYEAATLVGGFVINEARTVLVDPDEEGGKVRSLQGVGIASKLTRATVAGEFPTSRTRTVGIMSNDFNGVDQGAVEPFPYGSQAAPSPQLKNGNPGSVLGFPRGWPDPQAVYLSPRQVTGAGTTGDPYRHPEGVWWARREIPALVDGFGRCRIYAAMDSVGQIWWDGQKVIDTEDGTNFLDGLTADIDIGPGAHNVTARVVNRAPLNAGADNVTFLLLVIVQLDAEGEPAGILYRTFNSSGLSTWQAFDYPDPDPGLNAGIVMNLFRSESDARGTDTVTVDFDDTVAANGDQASETDTAGDVWTKVLTSWGWQVGTTDYLRVLQELSEMCSVDWWVSPTAVLSLWQNGRGVDRGGTPDVGVSTFALQAGVNLATYQVIGRDVAGNVIRVRTASSTFEVVDAPSVATSGRRESGLDVGQTDDPDEIGSAVDEHLAREAAPPDVAVAGVPRTDTVAWGTTFHVGDVIVAPDADGVAADWRIVEVVLDQDDEDALIDYTLTLEST